MAWVASFAEEIDNENDREQALPRGLPHWQLTLTTAFIPLTSPRIFMVFMSAERFVSRWAPLPLASGFFFV